MVFGIQIDALLFNIHEQQTDALRYKICCKVVIK